MKFLIASPKDQMFSRGEHFSFGDNMQKTVLILALFFGSLGLNAHGDFQRVSLSCRNPGSHQDVAKNPIITNNTRNPISSSTRVYWEATDGDKGFVQGPFKIGESKSGLGNAGNGYQCSAYYFVRIFN